MNLLTDNGTVQDRESAALQRAIGNDPLRHYTPEHEQRALDKVLDNFALCDLMLEKARRNVEHSQLDARVDERREDEERGAALDVTERDDRFPME